MADYASIEELKNAINDSIYQNDAGLVTAEILQERLHDIIDTLVAMQTPAEELPVATGEVLGGVIIGSGLSITEAGVLSSIAEGGVTPEDNILEWDDINSWYAPYADKSVGKFYSGTTDPDDVSTRLNYDGWLHLSRMTIKSTDQTSWGLYVTGPGGGIVGYCPGVGQGVSAQSSLGVSLRAQTASNLSANKASNLFELINEDAISTYSRSGTLMHILDNATVTAGSNTMKLLSAVINDTEMVLLYPRVADGESAIAYMLDTKYGLGNAGSKLLSIKNAAQEKVSVRWDGLISAVGGFKTTSYWMVEEGGKLMFKYGETNIMSIDQYGTLLVLNNVDDYATP